MTPAKKKAAAKAAEGAPDLQTPESPAPPPEDAPRDDQSPLETPESPAAPPVTREAFVEALSENSLHVSTSPVNSHAPVWLPREPNSP